jgi:GxxExxY protein
MEGRLPDDVIEKDLSYKIMKAAFEVHNQLGPGFLENIYEEAMTFELKAQEMKVERQKKIAVKYKEHIIGEHILDTVVNEKIILEYKAVSELAPIHEQQALSYLKATGLPLAIVINFGTRRVQYRRIVNTIRKSFHPIIRSRKLP